MILADALATHSIENETSVRARLQEQYTTRLIEELSGGISRPRALPGVSLLLERLASQQSVTLGLLTGNFRATARLKLEHFGLWHYFICGAFGDDAADRNGLVPIAIARARALGFEHATPERTIVIGDTPHDVRCAQAGGARSVGVATGSASASSLEAAGADVVFDDLSNVDDVLDAIGQLVASDPAMPIDCTRLRRLR